MVTVWSVNPSLGQLVGENVRQSEFSLVDWISPTGIYTGVLTCGFYCLENPWMDWNFLPPKLRMIWLLIGFNLIAGVLFTILGAKSLWDEWRYTDQR